MIRILDAQTKQLLGQVMMDDILKAGHLSEAHLRLLVDKIHVHEEDGKRSLDICLKAPFGTIWTSIKGRANRMLGSSQLRI